MIHHSLVCLLHEDPYKRGSFRNVTLSKARSLTHQQIYDLLMSVYTDNISRLGDLIVYASTIGIRSYRVSSSLFPLATHPDYADVANDILENTIFPILSTRSYPNMYLSTHPGQFTMLTSLRDDVNQTSINELNFWGRVSKWLPIDVVNIHGGARSLGFKHHKELFLRNFDKLDDKTKSILSLENDEKSYSASEILELCESAGCMMVYDFHHERCHAKRQEPTRKIIDIDYDNISNIVRAIDTYSNDTLPLFHLSSPRGGWHGAFKDWCAHSDLIDINDYPHSVFNNKSIQDCLTRWNGDARLDIEAKHKQHAILKLNKDLGL